MDADAPVITLGIGAPYHDAEAALVRDGEIVAAVQQGRFGRIMRDPAFPLDAIRSFGWEMQKDTYSTPSAKSASRGCVLPVPVQAGRDRGMDGVGEWVTSSISVGRGRPVQLQREQRLPGSRSLLYSAFTNHRGFQVNCGEYKLVGLAPYGEPTYVDRILDELGKFGDDGALRADLRCFEFD